MSTGMPIMLLIRRQKMSAAALSPSVRKAACASIDKAEPLLLGVQLKQRAACLLLRVVTTSFPKSSAKCQRKLPHHLPQRRLRGSRGCLKSFSVKTSLLQNVALDQSRNVRTSHSSEKSCLQALGRMERFVDRYFGRKLEDVVSQEMALSIISSFTVARRNVDVIGLDAHTASWETNRNTQRQTKFRTRATRARR